MEHQIDRAHVEGFARHLREEERSPGTVENYLRHIGRFRAWLEGRAVTRETVAEWKKALTEAGYAPASVNAMLVAVNALLRYLGWEECRARTLRLQRQLFRQEERELGREDYDRLVQTARGRGRERLALLMEAICATGIRVSEVRRITVEAARTGRTEISLKGKVRTILLPRKLCRKLLQYAGRQRIASGEIFLTRDGRPLSRKQIWAEMKALCQAAGVRASKVFPHNLRHLFARTFYKVCGDVVKLADILGHSRIETTRIYLISTGLEHARQLERLHLIS